MEAIARRAARIVAACAKGTFAALPTASEPVSRCFVLHRSTRQSRDVGAPAAFVRLAMAQADCVRLPTTSQRHASGALCLSVSARRVCRLVATMLAGRLDHRIRGALASRPLIARLGDRARPNTAQAQSCASNGCMCVAIRGQCQSKPVGTPGETHAHRRPARGVPGPRQAQHAARQAAHFDYRAFVGAIRSASPRFTKSAAMSGGTRTMASIGS